ncbi:hypothetical protein A3D00_04845 [Candidatus Woesebacteria bacterium RIFCSPHIGHO2_02_FULL_38_9]|uniref:Uncharacterized protein n=1 Tax=Candidatus Woesebacteria bacterium RIFCSPHIGHO2_01_FULL_39_28 TaxID=1802496 RepID=A0A1F7YB20_9BACT|nr:MAG: hypothetical protein A2627_02045 [Candidatus Woesebacteria bacterium RIFCSPHIGHO2_01_FULL_39_28]OGM32321.1 MAG: hypothetical protein A3D00_04845 [Candidatus Woesebacteria bacterium RIFCSPHIGHO2_02_FULL_38_9]OGM58385.1 MAG: hypothetical protein A3A50_02490 [Candidatus Woesebacteria bacterium RIFCSPLOWO2_01_FULL_38_20]
MLETPHVVVGAAIATKIGNPFLAIPLAFGSHFLLERVPHWNPHLNTELKKYGKPTKQSTMLVIVDVILSLTFGLSIASKVLPDLGHAATVVAACFFSVLPDIMEGPYYFLNKRNKLIEKWINFQKSIQADTSLIPGLLTQLATIFTAIWWISI